MTLCLRRRHVLGIAGSALLGVTGVHAGTFPGRPLSMIVPYPAGGPADAQARQLEPPMRDALGQPLVVDNVGGASGSIGIHKLLSAPPDGYTMLLGTPSEVILAPLALSAVKHTPEQLRLIGVTGHSPMILVGSQHLGPQSLEQLAARARDSQRPSLTYGSIGPGSLHHLILEDLASRWGVVMTHVPYKGVAPMVQDLMGGHLDLSILPSAGNVVDLITQGKLRAYAVADTRRLQQLAQVPTFAEAAGAGFRDFIYEIWGGMFVDRRIQLEHALRLNAALNAALMDVEFQQAQLAAGSVPGVAMSLGEAERVLTEQTARFRSIAQKINLRPQ
ncbi:tripartite tricarboxylate transporter substrate binding protein [Variovorax sp. J22R115]|uniref:Bug family tripartite tricarboxylate transporter substrate binding protein n=1 Tax=Variovorax sp. J22R115 TaxID=3053509 RepID=UPI0025765D60|nr:tripartite tricarboxylate transporter substrate binding protein [Variovorax sp. J22R115]MDM0049890.1 tripartite tricarboxylate transporter substrate binding protein [Variovorax sp. J22R115]